MAEAKPASALRVVGTGATLFLMLGALVLIVSQLVSAPIDGEARQRELFGEAPPPLGLALESAVRLPTGDSLVRFTREARQDDASAPREVLFIRYRDRAAVAPLFRPEQDLGGMGPRLAEWQKEKAFDWHTTMKGGEIAWGEWSTKLRIERSFRKGGGWSEEARVDLSSPERALVLFAHWPDEVPVDEAVLRTLLRALVLRPVAG